MSPFVPHRWLYVRLPEGAERLVPRFERRSVKHAHGATWVHEPDVACLMPEHGPPSTSCWGRPRSGGGVEPCAETGTILYATYYKEYRPEYDFGCHDCVREVRAHYTHIFDAVAVWDPARESWCRPVGDDLEPGDVLLAPDYVGAGPLIVAPTDEL